jgi:hypothetical protein
MKRFRLFSSPHLLAFVAMGLVWGLVFTVVWKRAGLGHESAGANRDSDLVRVGNGEQAPATVPYCRVYDETARDDSLLISKGGQDNSDLWFRDSLGRERFISKAVTDARFSPDGDKIVYATVDCEVFIETAAGERLVEISRAFDPVWGVEGKTVIFSHVPALEYPELQQRAIYDLASGCMAAASSPHFPSNTTYPRPPKPNRTYDKK